MGLCPSRVPNRVSTCINMYQHVSHQPYKGSNRILMDLANLAFSFRNTAPSRPWSLPTVTTEAAQSNAVSTVPWKLDAGYQSMYIQIENIILIYIYMCVCVYVCV